MNPKRRQIGKGNASVLAPQIDPGAQADLWMPFGRSLAPLYFLLAPCWWPSAPYWLLYFLLHFTPS